MPALNALAQRSYDATSTYGDVVHIVHVYVIEPHPQAPDVSPYGGLVWEAEYSTVRQPLTYEDRVAAAAATEALLEGSQLLLVDDLAHDGRTNPVWCTYGPAPNCGYLLGQDGNVDTLQRWLDVNEMEEAIDALLLSGS